MVLSHVLLLFFLKIKLPSLLRSKEVVASEILTDVEWTLVEKLCLLEKKEIFFPPCMFSQDNFFFLLDIMDDVFPLVTMLLKIKSL